MKNELHPTRGWLSPGHGFISALLLIIMAADVLQLGEAQQLQRVDNPPSVGTYYLFSQSDPESGNYFSGPPIPFNPYASVADLDPPMVLTLDPDHGIYLIMDSPEQYAMLQEQNQPAASALSAGTMTMSAMDLTPPDGGDGGTNGGWVQPDWTPLSFGSNELWLSIAQPANGVLPVTLHGMPSNKVYGLISKTNLSETAWCIEHSVPPATGRDWSATTVSVSAGAPAVFLAAQDWSGETNGMPIWWLLDNFSSLLATNVDYDGDGICIYAEWQQQIEPNKITFMSAVTNQYANINPVPVQLGVSGGVPGGIAILVDNTNFAEAAWNRYGTNENVSLDLGGVEGWHEVWIGLRGRLATSTPTWQRMRIKLDLTPPALIFTHPVSSVVAQPTLQVQGYCPERLARISYDLSNADGVLTHEPVPVLDQFYDTNTFEFTTNAFQAFDIELAAGTNTVTIHASDMAGNVTTTNLIFTLDYTGKTNPPLTRLSWPQDGAQISGSSFTLRGWVDDPTASVVAAVVDAGGVTNSASGQVGRNGDFAIRNLPLSDGLNGVNVTVTDVAGNSCSTNIGVFKSGLTLTVDEAEIGEGTLPQGGIGSPDYTVWINGVQGINHGDGTWSASAALTLDTPVVHVQAVPNENMGAGASGAARSSFMSASAGDPGSPVEVEIEAPWPDGAAYLCKIYLMEHFEDPTGSSDTMVDWDEPGGGIGYYLSPSPQYEYVQYQWPGGRWPLCYNNGTSTDELGTNRVILPAKDIFPNPTFGGYQFGGAWGAHSHTYNAQFKLITGGTPDSTGSRLYRISATALELVPSGQFGLQWQEVPIAFERICLGSLGNLGSDGQLYARLPVNSVIDITPHVDGPQVYTATPTSVQGYTPFISVNGIDLRNNTPEFCVGQQVTFELRFDPNLADLRNTVASWRLPNEFRNEAYQDCSDCSTNYRVNNSLLQQPSTTCWFIGGSGGFASVGANLQMENGNCVGIAAKENFSIYRPSVTVFIPSTQTHIVLATNDAPNIYLGLGDDMNGDMSWDASITINTNFPGTLFCNQLVNRNWTWDRLVWYGNIYKSDINGGYQLDNAAPSRLANISKTSVHPNQPNWFMHFGDGPELEDTLWSFADLNDSFQTYIEFQPDGGIPVTIGRADWSWRGRTDRMGLYDNPSWTLTTNLVNGPVLNTSDYSLPEWAGVYQNTGN